MKKATDHALVRYMDRVLGLDMEAYRQKMMTPKITDAIKAGCTAIYTDGFTYKLANGTITTVYKGQGNHASTPRMGED